MPKRPICWRILQIDIAIFRCAGKPCAHGFEICLFARPALKKSPLLFCLRQRAQPIVFAGCKKAFCNAFHPPDRATAMLDIYPNFSAQRNADEREARRVAQIEFQFGFVPRRCQHGLAVFAITKRQFPQRATRVLAENHAQTPTRCNKTRPISRNAKPLGAFALCCGQGFDQDLIAKRFAFQIHRPDMRCIRFCHGRCGRVMPCGDHVVSGQSPPSHPKMRRRGGASVPAR